MPTGIYIRTKPPWNKGTKGVVKHAKGLIPWNKGRKCPHWSGSSHPNWKGGITPLELSIRGSFENKQWIKQVFERDNYTCQECGDNKGGNLEAHHIKEFFIILAKFLKQYDQFSPIEDKETLVRLATKYKPFWDIGNGKTLCRSCHMKLHIKIKKMMRR